MNNFFASTLFSAVLLASCANVNAADRNNIVANGGFILMNAALALQLAQQQNQQAHVAAEQLPAQNNRRGTDKQKSKKVQNRKQGKRTQHNMPVHQPRKKN